ncbi:cyclic di-AMP binding protein CbpA [Alkalicoccus luteus]|uniref:CBS domain-containing protein n=1 Tax=Alkalicoccus luteus TaxID=1237094 RepID=A0A969PR44_9BACI|nr:cyclic di-AMP binding protein CbpA [Alkalicoccus luteus]NJP38891.1 CBS domain-containing protein [Alkalicoccus luteus]
MKIKYNIIPKDDVITCKASYTVGQALDVLEKSGFRCVPVLSEDDKYFKGNVYAQDVYKALLYGSIDKQSPLETLLADQDVHLQESASFFRIFKNIRRYPYIAVTDQENIFTGILTHGNVMSILEDSWGIESGNLTFTVSTHEYQGALSGIMTTVKKYSSIHSLMTLDTDSTFFRRVIVTLPKSTGRDKLDSLIQDLEGNGYRVFDVEEM